ncbi:MAG: 2-octaprenyl-6-methoxyphenyl hydroxylase [Acidiferrobacteraceae bacterium]|nr:2-octaprenyl-6-methoxyphenyl hydroxylase [Acidiferrobacteraceae bacterium]
MVDHVDVLIVGGGLAGASLACALLPLNIKITVIEAIPLYQSEQPSFDERTLAITWGSQQVLQAISQWTNIAREAYPIRSIEVSEEIGNRVVQLDSSLIGLEALGYVIPTRVIGEVLISALKREPSVRYLSPLEAESVNIKSDHVTLKCKDYSEQLSGRLLVIADGGRSTLSAMLGSKKKEKYYSQSALVTTVASNRDHGGVAHEHFAQQGPIALLPTHENRFAVAWTMSNARANHLKSSTDINVLSELQKDVGTRAGTLEAIGKRSVYQLRWASVYPPHANRTVLIGNAAHEVHPIAGQGFNLGLRDVAELADIIAHAIETGQDIGQASLVSKYINSRRRQTNRVLRFTDGLVKVFGTSMPVISQFRKLGLAAIESSTPVKKMLLERTAGLYGELPRLAQGIPLAKRE